MSTTTTAGRLTRSKADNDETRDQRPRRSGAGPKNYRGESDLALLGGSNSSDNDDGSSTMDVDDDDEDASPVASSEENNDEDEEMVGDDDDDDDDESTTNQRKATTSKVDRRANSGRRTAAGKKQQQQPSSALQGKNVRSSSRANKFNSSMAEPSESLRDLLSRKELLVDTDDDDDDGESKKPRARTTTLTNKPRKNSSGSTNSGSNNNNNKTKAKATVVNNNNNKKRSGNSSPQKSPARRHAQRRMSITTLQALESDDDDDKEEDEDDASSSANEDEDEEDEEPLKIQRIIACRTETKKKWNEICRTMNTSEIHYGSRWFQNSNSNNTSDTDDNAAAGVDATNPPGGNDDDDEEEERFLVKWSDLSFLHVSWETQEDLIDQCEGAKMYLTTFTRKSYGTGLLYTADERCDGDYFDPAFIEIDRILEVQMPNNNNDTISASALSAETEDSYNSKSFGMIMNKADPDFDDGTGRQFLIKWCHSPYWESTYEFERDLIINDIAYKDPLKEFLKRRVKPTKQTQRTKFKKGEDEFKRLYTIFGDKSKLSEADRETAIEEYKKALQDVVYKNGGQLRDYQAEGVAWMMANFVNQRSVILADEMGLGKTLQVAATANLLATALVRGGPILIVAPLSTLTHWYREFTRWTDLNTIVYHGSADDRKLIREHEFVYECDRPETAIAFNQLYLRKCMKRSMTKLDRPWMVDVVITSPEMMIADDATELSAVQWEVLVVDEAHRLKNFNSKLAVGLRNEKFSFRHRILLTGTPIQNDVQEFWTLLNFIDPDGFNSMNDFMERYGDMKSKERVDELHEEIRPFILRRLKEDVERSVPPKEETLIEVELTIAQKKYYRALYEKNVKFLNKNKKKALEGPSLNNLAMQLRKCCNHLFLLNGIETEFRKTQEPGLSEADYLVRGSGKLVLLDKLLPRLREEGHRVLLFSQFKIMLDILEDYLNARNMKFERIDGSITGNKRQQAIDRFQTPSTPEKEAPFIMMLSTRAGGVGITLTAADTCIIVDSDWNPQNDLQAQARCHRIGQTKSVKVYRLLTRQTYEMQMFHMSSLKMGLDQAVLKGFESRASGEGALSKDEVERLLRHGAYDIFNEDKAGEAEAKSNDFVQQDIDTILQRHSQTIVHENTGTKSLAGGGTFSKASFKAKLPDSKNDVDIEDPDFWKKIIGDGAVEDEEEIDLVRRSRTQKNYSDRMYEKELEKTLRLESDGDSSGDEYDNEAAEEKSSPVQERLFWGGSSPTEWKKDDVESLIKSLSTFGYDCVPWDDFVQRTAFRKSYDVEEIKRMCWTVVLLTILDCAEEDGKAAVKRETKIAEKIREQDRFEQLGNQDGGVLAVDRSSEVSVEEVKKQTRLAFEKLWYDSSEWMKAVISDAMQWSVDQGTIQSEEVKSSAPATNGITHGFETASKFATTIWPILKSKGWNARLETDDMGAATTRYSFQGKSYSTTDSVLKASLELYPELVSVGEGIKPAGICSQDSATVESKTLSLVGDAVDAVTIRQFLERYGPKQMMADREKSKKLRLTRKILTACSLMHQVVALLRKVCDASAKYDDSVNKLASSLNIDKRTALPHPLWTVRHDAVLLHAIAKHGWLEQESAASAIAHDVTVKWGLPFDNRVVGNGETAASETTKQIIATANRAAAFLTKHSDWLVELKGFNLGLVVRAYSLTRPSQSDDDDDIDITSPRSWIVEPSGLQGADKQQDATGSTNLVDLPLKKELSKRAKSVLTRMNVFPIANKRSDSTSEYAELDQKDGANIFLAEMLRTLLKESSSSKNYKKLCTLAAEEARCRAKSMASGGSPDHLSAACELQRIAEYIDEFKMHFAKANVQYKNVVRVVLGEEIHKPRREGEGAFPSKRPVSSLATAATTTTTAVSFQATTRPSSRPLGEKAIAQARQRLIERYAFSDGTSVPSKAMELELTEIETLILLGACSVGIPVWREDWMSILESTKPSPSEGGCITWHSFGMVVVKLSETCLEHAALKLEADRARFERPSNVVASATSESVAREKAKASLECSTRTYNGKEAAVSQAKDYAAEPETLAKKTIMLLEKIRKHMPSVAISALTVRSDNGLGAKVLHWLGKEIARWSNALDLIGDDGRPLAFTAVEFLDELPEEERRSIEVSSVFDKKGCRQVISQVAMMSRNRSLATSFDQSRFVSEVTKAAVVLNTPADKWDKQPDCWNEKCDATLLRRLLLHGMTDELLSVTGNGSELTHPSFSSSVYRLSKGALQQRANQLVRILHASEEVLKFRIFEDRQNDAIQPAVVEKVVEPTFGSNRFSKPQSETISLMSDDDEVKVVSPTAARHTMKEDNFQQFGKRKKSVDDNGDSSADKKRRE